MVGNWFLPVEDKTMTKQMTSKTSTTSKKLNKAETVQFNKLPTKSARIRYLDMKGWTRSDIAIRIGIRYQHVRNVLITPLTGK